MTNSRLLEPDPYLVTMGIILGALWFGSRLVHGGALTQVLFSLD